MSGGTFSPCVRANLLSAGELIHARIASLKDCFYFGLDFRIGSKEGVFACHESSLSGADMVEEIEDGFLYDLLGVLVDGDLSHDVSYLWFEIIEYEQSIPEIVESKDALGAHLGRLVVRVNESSSEFDGVWQVFFDELLREVEHVCHDDLGLSVGKEDDVLSVYVAVSTGDLLCFRVPDDQLFVGFLHGVVRRDVDRFSRTTSVESERPFAQSSDFAHDIRRILCGDNVELIATFIGISYELRSVQFLDEERSVNRL